MEFEPDIYSYVTSGHAVYGPSTSPGFSLFSQY